MRHHLTYSSMQLLCGCVCDTCCAVNSDGCRVDSSVIALFLSAVPGTHLEGETHAHRARSAILPQTDNFRPQIPPQQRDPAQRSQTRYVSM